MFTKLASGRPGVVVGDKNNDPEDNDNIDHKNTMTRLLYCTAPTGNKDLSRHWMLESCKGFRAERSLTEQFINLFVRSHSTWDLSTWCHSKRNLEWFWTDVNRNKNPQEAACPTETILYGIPRTHSLFRTTIAWGKCQQYL